MATEFDEAEILNDITGSTDPILIPGKGAQAIVVGKERRIWDPFPYQLRPLGVAHETTVCGPFIVPTDGEKDPRPEPNVGWVLLDLSHERRPFSRL